MRIQLTLLILQFYEIRTLNGQISSPPTCPKMSQIKVVCGKEASVGRWSEAPDPASLEMDQKWICT